MAPVVSSSSASVKLRVQSPTKQKVFLKEKHSILQK
jgi:hypothetical protein